MINFSYIDLGNRVEWQSFINANRMRSFSCLSKTLLKESKWCYLQSINSFADYSWSDLVVLSHCSLSIEGVRNGEKWKQQENNSPQNSWAKDSHLRNPHTETPRPSSHSVQTHCGFNNAVTSPVWSDDAMCEISTVIIHARGQWGWKIFTKVQCKVTSRFNTTIQHKKVIEPKWCYSLISVEPFNVPLRNDSLLLKNLNIWVI